MAGPYQPYRQVGAEVNRSLSGPVRRAGCVSRRLPGHAAAAGGLSEATPQPNAVAEPAGAGLAGAIVAAVLTIRADRPATGAALFTEPAVKTAIQNYLSALSNGDLDVIARNNLCGLYDGVRTAAPTRRWPGCPVTPSAGSSSRLR